MGWISDYIDARIEQAKLKAADGASASFAAVLSVCVILILAMVVLSTAAFALILLLGELMGSYALGAGIVCGFFLLILLVCLLLRKRLFRGMFVKMLLKDDRIRSYRQLEDAEIAASARAEQLQNSLASDLLLELLRGLLAKAAKPADAADQPKPEQPAEATEPAKEEEKPAE